MFSCLLNILLLIPSLRQCDADRLRHRPRNQLLRPVVLPRTPGRFSGTGHTGHRSADLQSVHPPHAEDPDDLLVGLNPQPRFVTWHTHLSSSPILLPQARARGISRRVGPGRLSLPPVCLWGVAGDAVPLRSPIKQSSEPLDPLHPSPLSSSHTR